MEFGIDEVGRGCWAGPLVVSAVALNAPIGGLNDSKKLSARKRQELLLNIITDANIVITSFIHAENVDRLGLGNAMSAAVGELFSSISKHSFDSIIIDGNINFLPDEPKAVAEIGADGHNQACMAASIVAKEARDAYMRQLGQKHPEYGFEKHVGYGTAQHKAAIEEFGVLDEHRKSFKPIKKIIERTR